MHDTHSPSKLARDTPPENKLDMKLEVVVIPVSDVERAKNFYDRLGWKLDLDFANGEHFRVVQYTPPGSGCSVIFGTNVTAAAPGSAQGLHLVVSNIETTRDELRRRGVGISECRFAPKGEIRNSTKSRASLCR